LSELAKVNTPAGPKSTNPSIEKKRRKKHFFMNVFSHQNFNLFFKFRTIYNYVEKVQKIISHREKSVAPSMKALRKLASANLFVRSN
jgi:hypothetical protein